jgi:hypothetical protein
MKLLSLVFCLSVLAARVIYYSTVSPAWAFRTTCASHLTTSKRFRNLASVSRVVVTNGGLRAATLDHGHTFSGQMKTRLQKSCTEGHSLARVSEPVFTRLLIWAARLYWKVDGSRPFHLEVYIV